MSISTGAHPDSFSSVNHKATTLVDLLRWRAMLQPERTAYTFLAGGAQEGFKLTYRELDQRAMTIGALLQSKGASGERVLLLYPPGLDYIAAFFGCLYAGAVAVPAYPPRPNHSLQRLKSIILDARAAAVLGTATTISRVEPLVSEADAANNLHLLMTDEIAQGLKSDWREPALTGDSLAMLQYTSGSTGSPKGVMLSHANLLHNSALIEYAFEYTSESICVSWLPVYHDMGLIGGVIQPLYGGFPCVLMSPVTFLQSPISWLQAISKFKATISGAPNFAFDLCIRKISPEQRATLDLSSWAVAFDGSEPARWSVLQRFAETFEPFGFRKQAFYPCYGLAEATLMVSGSVKGAGPVVKHFDIGAIEKNLVVETSEGAQDCKPLVSCGRALPEERIIIVNPQSSLVCEENEIGEIWVSGPNVAGGYWNQPEQTQDTFQARTADTRDGPFLRTGDTGFLKDGDLYITGRLKDLIIIRGLNHYPQDIEATVHNSHPGLKPGCGAAFSIVVEGEEKLVIVQEVDARLRSGFDEVIDAIRTTVVAAHGLQPHAIGLIKSGTTPKTSSGKLQRHACRDKYLSSDFQMIADWKAVSESQGGALALPISQPPRSAQEISAWLVSHLVARTGMSSDKIDVNQPISRYGLDSLSAIELMYKLESELAVFIPMAQILESSSIAQLAIEAEGQLTDGSPGAIAATVFTREANIERRLTLGQKALWFLHELAPESAAYNIAAAVLIKSEVDSAVLRRVFQSLVNRHAALRTTFISIRGEPIRHIHEEMDVYFQTEDASNWDEAYLNKRLVEQTHWPPNLEQGPLLRVSLFALKNGEHVLLMVVHHIVSDFWSLGLLMHELGLLYPAEKTGAELPLAPLSVSYDDHVRQQFEMLASTKGERLWAHWQEQLKGGLPILSLPTDKPRPPVQTFKGASYPFRLNTESTRMLNAFSRARGLTLYTTLLSAFQVLLHRTTGQNDLLVGSPVAGRNAAEFAEVVGYFVNPVVLRAFFSEEETFETLLQQVRRTVLEALKHQDYPFPLLVERLQPERDPSRSPIFQVMFILHKTHLLNDQGIASFALGETGAQMELGGLLLESLALQQRVTQFDLTLVMAETDSTMGASLQFNTDLFDVTTIARMAGHFQILLDASVADPRQRISQLPFLTEAETYQLLIDWNNTTEEFPRDLCVHQLFEAQVNKSPDSIALIFEGAFLTYRELNRRANQLAHYLQSLGVEPETAVGVCVDRSLDMMVALIGVLKAGAAYVPLDPAHPKDRLNLVIEDLHSPAILTQVRLRQKVAGQSVNVICLDAGSNQIALCSEENPTARIGAENLAYTIYTSGSTGKPKGVMVSHRAVVNFFTGMDRRIGCDREDILFAVTGISFDISVLELFWTLTRGATVVLLSEQAISGTFSEPKQSRLNREIEFSLFYFASNDSEQMEDKYRLLLEGAKFADQHGFAAVWTPERHFHAFGGLYPNPSVMSAALAVMTERIEIRAGSIVLPLHNPIRVAEEWALVDNLSKGRTAIAFASGWHSDDFAFFPDNYADRKEIMFSGIETIKKLWRGESLMVRGGAGNEVAVNIYPKPVRQELPIWITAAGTPDTFLRAGQIGANVLTHLLGQTLEEVAHKIMLYREALAAHGHDARTRQVTLMLHCFIGENTEAIREKVRKPFTQYLKTSVGLIANLIKSLNLPLSLNDMSEKDMDDLMAYAFDRYFETSALFGTPETCAPMIEQLKAIGVDEVACLVDFGVDADSALAALVHLNTLKELANTGHDPMEYSLPSQAMRHHPSLIQCTPSMLRMHLLNPLTMDSLRSLRTLMLGGEALPQPLAKQVVDELECRVVNMYGPTETTIWSATHELCEAEGILPIGQPIANTQIYILDPANQPVPAGVAGEIHISGDGLARGYFNRPELTADRFIPNSFTQAPGSRAYKTGDLARHLPDGSIEYLSRIDHQLKIRGYRVELEEIEVVLSTHPSVKEAVVVASEDSSGDRRLAAYIIPDSKGRPSTGHLRSFLKEKLPDYMIPAAFVMLDAFPLTANGKVDRKSLPAPESSRSNSGAKLVAPRNKLESEIAEIWRQALKVGEVGIHDNFFDLGGHSLLMAQVHSRLREMFKTSLPLIALLEHPTISSLARYLSQERSEDSTLEKNRDRASHQREAFKRQRQSQMRTK